MIGSSKKLLQAAAGAAGGDPLNVEDVFGINLWDGIGSGGPTQIRNGLDLSGKGGMTWLKSRNAGKNYLIQDTERGAVPSSDRYYYIRSNTTAAQDNLSSLGTVAFQNNGYDIGDGWSDVQGSGNRSVGWSFRKAPNFFDIVTYSGDGSNSRTISHNLGSIPGMIMIKRLDSAVDWQVYHRGNNNGNSPAEFYLTLNGTDAAHQSQGPFDNSGPTASVFSVGGSANTNHSSGTYVAYLFAHHNNDGEFGPDADQDIIKCGYGVTPGSATDLEINLGFEPQFVMYKLSGTAGSWYVHDDMRSLTNNDATDPTLYWNQNYYETQITSNNFINPTPTGFRLTANAVSQALGTNANFVYLAIRRGPMAVPESGTEVYMPKVVVGDRTGDHVIGGIGFSPDLVFGNGRGGDVATYDKRRGRDQSINMCDTSAETNDTSLSDFMDDGYRVGSNGGRFYDDGSGSITWSFKRAPKFFEIIAYTGNGSDRVLDHGLGVPPELIITKRRQQSSNGWITSFYEYFVNTRWDRQGRINQGAGLGGGGLYEPASSHSATQYAVGSYDDVNGSGGTFVAYLFATLENVSKVGSYTGDGTTGRAFDCGFTTGARFILIAGANVSTDWYVWDSARGIVTGNDPHISLTDGNEGTGDDTIDPSSSGFILNQNGTTNLNASGSKYVFLAVS